MSTSTDTSIPLGEKSKTAANTEGSGKEPVKTPVVEPAVEPAGGAEDAAAVDATAELLALSEVAGPGEMPNLVAVQGILSPPPGERQESGVLASLAASPEYAPPPFPHLAAEASLGSHLASKEPPSRKEFPLKGKDINTQSWATISTYEGRAMPELKLALIDGVKEAREANANLYRLDKEREELQNRLKVIDVERDGAIGTASKMKMECAIIASLIKEKGKSEKERADLRASLAKTAEEEATAFKAEIENQKKLREADAKAAEKKEAEQAAHFEHFARMAAADMQRNVVNLTKNLAKK